MTTLRMILAMARKDHARSRRRHAIYPWKVGLETPCSELLDLLEVVLEPFGYLI